MGAACEKSFERVHVGPEEMTHAHDFVDVGFPFLFIPEVEYLIQYFFFLSNREESIGKENFW